jgi:hypothetical protein
MGTEALDAGRPMPVPDLKAQHAVDPRATLMLPMKVDVNVVRELIAEQLRDFDLHLRTAIEIPMMLDLTDLRGDLATLLGVGNE